MEPPEPPLPRPPAGETSQFYSSATSHVRPGSLLLQSVSVTVPTFTNELDLGSVAQPEKYSDLKQYFFASLLFKPFLALLLDCFSLSYLAAWIKDSAGKGNRAGLIVYGLATAGSLGIVLFGGWRASQVLQKGHIQAIYVNREAYRWICLRNKDKYLFFERVATGHGYKDALIFFAWFTLRDWMQHLLCDLPRLIINCTLLAQVAHQRSLIDKGEAPTLNMPDMSGITHVAIAINIMLHVCNLCQFIGALVLLVMSRMRLLVSLRKDEHMHTYCQRNLNFRIVRIYKQAKSPGTTVPLSNNMEPRNDEESGIDLSMVAMAWDTETQDDHTDYNHYAYRPRPMSNQPPRRQQTIDEQTNGGNTSPPREGRGGLQNETIEMSETRTAPTRPNFPAPGSFSHAQMQHLESQRQKYGDKRELYEPMRGNSASSFDGLVQGQSQNPGTSQAQYQVQGHNQTQFAPQPPGGNRTSWTQPPAVPPKNL
ncbi:hypothetical protein B0O80DRAFT_430500 [Mortierella sp. GBAus27b]|nr:hypothetical protein BGX31_007782 [Mortierella sp. GBA43]KAI8347046.1 hypothetical protein B0O80DRAFT_430500 [Mortierella sp. GBAus27b]